MERKVTEHRIIVREDSLLHAKVMDQLSVVCMYQVQSAFVIFC